ncbi:uncharacterized protein K460DRAFT_408819 [Cucurbitaria berberidis CBS 394.84]|uniref:Uncharacterized protein n=1 Tax=Cucurbitaria berberidis CBS 394.84 TaxID=1168544 RepID=A0A9P4G979_9PLEO|nr:uncharacterized protein K460DRAFT_408819 [Cucurbitaria berberidis CBS 394.84]KAF1841350.1 hypothetical protein K460DRAFT_408819 [Cucurbitaria berberidis CBS 394.84]
MKEHEQGVEKARAVISFDILKLAPTSSSRFGFIDDSSITGFISFVKLAEELTNKAVRTCLDNPQLFPPESKTYIVCATLNNNVVTAPEQLRVIVQWHYEWSNQALIDNDTHLGTVFIDGRSGSPRAYVEDRDITDVPENAPAWRVAVENGQTRYQLTISNVVIESQTNPPVNQWILNGQKWIMWNGHSWASQ